MVVAALEGRHFRQARYPAKSTSFTVPKNSTLPGRGFLAEHEGRQKIPVVLTAV
jgi:hypothetical protein